jgi:hypothetical protein
VQLETGRLRADRCKCGSHGADDKVPFTASNLAGAGASHLHLKARRPHRGGDAVVHGQRKSD